MGRAEAESSRGVVTLHQCSHSGVGTKASPLGFHPSVHSRSAAVQTFSGFQSPTHRCAEPRWQRPRAPDLQRARGAPPLPRCCQQPADPTVPGRTGAATLTTRADDRSHNQGPTGPPRALRQMGAGAALTRRQRLLRPRQQHSRRTPAPSSAAALASAAATNRPSGAANRHNRRRPAAERPARPGASAVAGSAAAAAQTSWHRAGTRVRPPRHWDPRQPELGDTGSRPPRGLLLSTRPFRRRARREAASRGRGAPDGAAGASAQIRKSLSSRDGRGSVRRCRCPAGGLSVPLRQLRSPKVSLTFWPRQTDPAEAGAAGGGRVSAVQLRGLLGRPKCRDSTEVGDWVSRLSPGALIP